MADVFRDISCLKVSCCLEYYPTLTLLTLGKSGVFKLVPISVPTFRPHEEIGEDVVKGFTDKGATSGFVIAEWLFRYYAGKQIQVTNTAEIYQYTIRPLENCKYPQ